MNSERSNEQRTRGSLSDQKERKFPMTLEIKGKKIGESKQFFLSVERPLNINIVGCNFIRSLGIGK